jgi:hypothetical protein
MVWPSTCLVTFEQHVDLALVSAPFDHAAHHAPHPAGAFAARRALAAALMLEEVADAGDRAIDVGGLVHDDDAGGAECRLHRARAVEIHDEFFAIRSRDQRARCAAGMIAFRLSQPPRMPPPCFSISSRNGMLMASSTIAGRVHMAGDAEQLGADIVRPADRGEPGAPRRRMSGATAMDSTLFTVVGQP